MFGWQAVEERQARLAVRQFIAAAQSGDFEKMGRNCLNDLQDMGYCRGGGWRNAMRGVARLQAVHPDMIVFFTDLWYRQGESLRENCDHDAALTLGLWKLLTPYSGAAHLQLYRGESEQDRRYRRVGLSWTVELEIAQHHAKRKRSHRGGGGVVIGALIPASAIICGPLVSDTCEQEYLVDRKFLRHVPIKVHERFET